MDDEEFVDDVEVEEGNRQQRRSSGKKLNRRQKQRKKKTEEEEVEDLKNRIQAGAPAKGVSLLLSSLMKRQILWQSLLMTMRILRFSIINQQSLRNYPFHNTQNKD